MDLSEKEGWLNLPNIVQNNTDYFGWIIPDRHNKLFDQIFSTFQPKFNVLFDKPEYKMENIVISPVNENIRFNSSFTDTEVKNIHFQLHNSVCALSEDTVLYAAADSIKSLNRVTKTCEKAINVADVSNMCSDPTRQRLSFFFNETKWSLYNLATGKEEITRSFEDCMGTSVFVDPNTVALSGNLNRIEVIDVTTQKPKQLIVPANFVNHIEFSPEFELYLLGMDNVDFHLVDARSGKFSHCLTGHLDFGFSGRFLNGYQVVTGSQDTSARIWDIRKPSEQLQILPALHSGIYAMEFHPQLNLLVTIESCGVIHFYKLNPDLIQQTCELFPCIMAGLSFSPSKSSLFLGLAEHFIPDYAGIAIFDILPDQA